MDKKTHTPRETFVYRAYHKHFHPDRFVGHPHSRLVNECAVIVNRGYEACCDDFCEVAVALGLMLKDALKGA